jgi:hypothetical protein
MFRPTEHGFRFANSYPDRMPVFELRTPLGTIPLGNAAKGLCGGMVFAAVDLFQRDVTLPELPTAEWVEYFGRRLLASWDIPFGVLRYYDWMRRSDAEVAARSANAWRAVKARLDRGLPAPLGLVKAAGWDPRKLGHNHQVLAFSYAAEGDSVRIRIYDPNYPNDDALSLSFVPGSGPVVHSAEGPSVRGLFGVPYRRPLWSRPPRPRP